MGGLYEVYIHGLRPVDQGVYIGGFLTRLEGYVSKLFIHIYIYISLSLSLSGKVRKVRGNILDVPMIRIIICWRVLWGPLFRETTICMQEYKVPDLF